MPSSDSASAPANKVFFNNRLVLSIGPEYLFKSSKRIDKLLIYPNSVSTELSHRSLSDRKLVLVMKHAGNRL